jgi:hypothetical protein
MDLKLPADSPWSTINASKLVRELADNIRKVGEGHNAPSAGLRIKSFPFNLTLPIEKLETTFCILRALEDPAHHELIKNCELVPKAARDAKEAMPEHAFYRFALTVFFTPGVYPALRRMIMDFASPKIARSTTPSIR